MARPPKLSVIIVSFNTRDLTAHAIDSVFSTYDDSEVIVVDNNSKDDSVSFLKKKFGSKITLTVNTDNVGFARANNQGVQQATGTYVMLLNSDTVVHPGALASLVTTLESHEEIGIVAANLRNPDGTYQPQGGALPTLLNVKAWWLWPFPGNIPFLAPYQNTQEPVRAIEQRGWVGGTALAIKRDLYMRLGGLDEGIFMYAEDVDLCLRVAQQKLQIVIHKDAWITHFGMASGSSSKARLGEIKGLLYLFGKHRTSGEVVLLRIIFVLGSLLRYLLFGILKGSSEARALYSQAVQVALR
jgi:GT2 family glycosyltransferase